MAKKLYYKIGEACKELDIQPYVLRYWETEFQALSPSKSKSGQRVYSAEDLELIRRIKELLYEEGYTIAGAKKKLDSEVGSRPKAVAAEADAEGPEDAAAAEEEATEEAEELDEEPQVDKVPVEKPEAPAPAKPAKRAPKKAAAKAKPARPKLVPTAQDQKIANLQRGIREAIQEAKGLLDLLDSA